MTSVMGIDWGSTQIRTALAEGGKVEMVLNHFSAQRIAPLLSLDSDGAIRITSPRAEIGKNDGIHAEAVKTFGQLREDAREADGNVVDRAVISVPAWFTEVQRERIRDAGHQAGFTGVRLLDEATASLLGMDAPTGEALVVCLGARGSQISLIRKSTDARLSMRKVDAEASTGGYYFDQLMVRFIRSRIGAGERVPEEHLQRMVALAERTKIALSRRESEDFDLNPAELLEAVSPLAPVRIHIHRAEFEQEIEPEVHRMAARILALKGTDHVDYVVFCGGSTRIPIVEQRLTETLSGIRWHRAPDSAIARGAAIFGSRLETTDWALAKPRPAETPPPNNDHAPKAPVGRSRWTGQFTDIIERAERAWNEGRHQEAIDTYREFALHTAPRFLHTLLVLHGKELFHANRFSEAVKCLEEAYGRDAGDKETAEYYHVSLNHFARQLHEAGDHPKALLYVNQGLRLNKQCAGCRELHARIDQALRQTRQEQRGKKRGDRK